MCLVSVQKFTKIEAKMSDAEDISEVEKILKRKLVGNDEVSCNDKIDHNAYTVFTSFGIHFFSQFHYLLKWANHSEKTWEPRNNLIGCQELLDEFEKNLICDVISEFFYVIILIHSIFILYES